MYRANPNMENSPGVKKAIKSKTSNVVVLQKLLDALEPNFQNCNYQTELYNPDLQQS